jgi:hypothetical protein
MPVPMWITMEFVMGRMAPLARRGLFPWTATKTATPMPAALILTLTGSVILRSLLIPNGFVPMALLRRLMIGVFRFAVFVMMGIESVASAFLA